MTIKHKLWKEYALLTAALVWSVFSYFFSFAGEPDIWFSRSGALMVFVAITVEYRLGGMLLHRISAANAVASLGVPAGVSVPAENKQLAMITHIFALLGTVIWAYGDLVYV